MVMQVLSPLDHYVLSHAVCVQTNSEKMAAYLSHSRQIDRKKFVVVRNWQDEKPFLDYAKNRRVEPEDRPFTFMYVGNVGPLAGIDVLFEAFAQAGLKDARLVIAGSGPAKEDLQRKAERYACTIEFWDVPTGMVPETQAKADVLLLPVKKGFARYSVPSKLIAYLFSAKPVIASVDKDSDTAECVEKSGAGWVIHPEDVASLSRVMQEVFCERSVVLELKGKDGFDFATKFFSKKQNLETLVNVCDEILNLI
jgi:glycosyltransferase involved in cell wall biosynthesis